MRRGVECVSLVVDACQCMPLSLHLPTWHWSCICMSLDERFIQSGSAPRISPSISLHLHVLLPFITSSSSWSFDLLLPVTLQSWPSIEFSAASGRGIRYPAWYPSPLLSPDLIHNNIDSSLPETNLVYYSSFSALLASRWFGNRDHRRLSC